jgi:DNA-binding transcriptional LysR family regulator
VAEAERAAAGEYAAPRGELVVTAPIAFGRLHVLPVVIECLARYPEIDVRLTLSDRNVDLIDAHIDVAVRIGALADSGLVATRVGFVRRVVCASPDFIARHGEPKAPSDLTGLACIGFEGLGAGGWTFEASGARAAPAVKPRLTVTTAEAAIDAATAGVGVTRVLSYQAAEAVAAGTLTIVLASFEPAPLPVQLVHAGQGLLPQKTRAFLDLATERLRGALRAA